MYFPEIKQKAIQLRKEGYSHTYILKHVPVAKSTLSDWLQDIPFTPNKHTLDTIKKAHLASGLYKHNVKVTSLEKAEVQARKDIGVLSNRDITMLGLGLYIGEGSKTMNITRISNSDPKVIKLALKWFKSAFGVQTHNVKIRLFLYPDSNKKNCIVRWSKETGVPESQFFKPTIDKRINKKTSNNGKLPFGTAHVSIIGMGNPELSVYLHRRIMAWINQVL